MPLIGSYRSTSCWVNANEKNSRNVKLVWTRLSMLDGVINNFIIIHFFNLYLLRQNGKKMYVFGNDRFRNKLLKIYGLRRFCWMIRYYFLDFEFYCYTFLFQIVLTACILFFAIFQMPPNLLSSAMNLNHAVKDIAVFFSLSISLFLPNLSFNSLSNSQPY